MIDKDSEFLKQLMVTFKVEADEHLKAICAGLLRLEQGRCPEEERATLVETIFREAHSLKGAARSVNLKEIESFCQAMESVFSALKKEKLTVSAELFDLLQEAVDILGLMLTAENMALSGEEYAHQRQVLKWLVEVAREQKNHDDTRDTGNTVPLSGSTSPRPEIQEPSSLTSPPAQLNAADVSRPEPLPRPAPPLPVSTPDTLVQQAMPPQPLTDTVRVETTRLASVLLQAEEMLSAKLACCQHAVDMRKTEAVFRTWHKEWGRVRPLVQGWKNLQQRENRGGIGFEKGEQQRALTGVLEFLEWNHNFFKELETLFKVEAKSAERNNRVLGSMVNNLLDDTKKVLMFPFSTLLEILPKTVRDLSRDYGKKIELSIEGGEIEIDRRILEEMKDPLLHLVRNCIDHGIEPPAERKGKGKSEQGLINITIAPLDDKVELIVADDGRGVAVSAVRSALAMLGTVSQEKLDELKDEELVTSIFQSGISTSSIITEISGRGLGLAIVREKVEKLGGSIAVETVPESGTTFRIVLPLTVATFRGLLVRLGEFLFVLPTMHIERVLRIRREAIKTVENRETISLGKKVVSLCRLADILELAKPQAKTAASELLPLVVLVAGGTSIAFLVDEVMGEQEVLLKRFSRQLSRVRNVAGATVLGNGRVVPILNVTDLLKSATKISSSVVVSANESRWGAHDQQKRTILLAEDSITTRTLLKNILENVGYTVVTAVDGADALSKLKSRAVDLVVSDVEMPRMNGFELTAKIRCDRGLEDLPVVLVTALASREDQERGIDVGANAYIVKSSFDQDNLLEVIERLV